MAIRLYPNAPKEVLEQLAGVPAGTYDRLEAYELKRPGITGPTMTAWYDKLYQDSDLVNMSNFKTFGWGRMTPAALDYKMKHFPDSEYTGSTNDYWLAQGFIQAMGITAEDVTSVRWS